MTFASSQSPLPAPPAPPGDRDDPARAPWGLTTVYLGILAALLISLVGLGGVGLALQSAGLPTDESNPTTAAVLVISQIVLDWLVVAMAAYLSLGRYRVGPRAWGLRRDRPIAWGWCFATVFAAFGALAAYGLLTRLPGLDRLQPESNVPTTLFDQRSVVPFTVVLVLVVAPLAEEMFFRGFIFRGFQGRLGLWGAALASGVLFSLIHLSIGLIVPFTIIGFLFAVLAGRTGSLWNAIIVHAMFNFVGVVAQFAPSR